VQVGSNIGQYRLVRKIGAGGMGAVWLGEHTLLGRQAAIKTLLPSLSIHRDLVDRFFNEARATSVISDPGVVQIFDFGYHVDGTAYIVMELLEGEALAARIERMKFLPPIDALRIGCQCAGSLAAAHELGIVHRDLKPENVFLTRDEEVRGGERPKILDFGICKLGVDGDKVLTQSGAVLGTPVYMSPEQCRGAGRVDHRSDIYALGCVLFHMLTGRPPFKGDGVGDYIAAHLREDPPAPSTYVDDIPLEVDALILRCLAKAPEKRFQSMRELQHAIDHVLAKMTGPGTGQHSFATAATTPLADGFKSVYDGNLGGAHTTEDDAPVGPTSQALYKPVTLFEQDRKGLRAALGVLVVGGVLAALAASRVAGDVEKATAMPAAAAEVHASGVGAVGAKPAEAADTAETTEEKDELTPPPIELTPTAPPIQIVEAGLPLPAVDAPTKVTAPAPAKARPAKKIAKPKATKPRSATRARKAPTPPPLRDVISTEDLYETR
jgi:serine/threonine-protein kinase